MRNLSMPLSIDFAVVISVLLSSCKQQRGASHPGNGPFSITNTVFDDGSQAWIIKVTNGPVVTLEQNNLTIYFQVDNTITAWFDPQTKKLTKTMLETPASENEPGQWVTDLNADGIPEMRRIKGKAGRQVFYKGEWYWLEPGGGTNKIVTIDGKRTTLFFDGKSWKEAVSTK